MASVRLNGVGVGVGVGGGRVVALAAALTAGSLVESAYAGRNVQVDRVAKGHATFDQNGGLLTIHAGDRTVINYKRFDVAGGETVRFIQPSASSRVLNRINSATPSRIDGTVRANGIVYFVNPAGVMFGPNAVINVGQFYAAAGNITDQNFLNNVNRFQATGAVVNAGVINADAVALIGRSVSNAGTISAEGGLVTMVAGDDVLIGTRDGHIMVKLASTQQPAAGAAGAQPQGGVTNTGTVTAQSTMLAAGDLYSLAIGGSVKSKAVTANAGGDVAVTGKIDASDAAAGSRGGSVVVTGKNVTLQGATIDASGDAGGGTVLVGGDFQGKGETPRATNTVVDNGTTLTVSATGNGDGGKVVVWSDGKTTYSGSIYAKGGAAGGNGGQVEVSGKQHLDFNGQVDTTAPEGSVGSLLLDPHDLTIQAGSPDVHGDGSDQDVSGDIAAGDDGANDSWITAGQLVTLLNTTDVSLAATHDITVGAAVDASTNAGSHALTLDAGQDLNVNQPIALKDANLTLTAAAGTVGVHANLNTGAGSILITGGQSITVDSGAIVQTTGGGITLNANQGGTPTAGNFVGVTLDNAASITSDTGPILLQGKGGDTGAANYGVVIQGGATVSSTGTGAGASTITINGSSQGGTDFNTGLFMAGAGSSVTSKDGAIQITGTGGLGTGDSNAGIRIQSSATVSSTNDATITINGTGGGAGGSTLHNYGVDILANSDTLVTSKNGDIRITGTGGQGGANHGISIGTTGGGVTSTGTADITLVADDIVLDTVDAQINAGANTVTFQPETPGATVNLGADSAAGQLGLTQDELARVTAGTVQIGSVASGNISVSDTITQAGTGWNRLHLVTGGSVSDAAGGTLTADRLDVDSVGGVALSGRTHSVGTFTATNTGGGAIGLNTSGSVALGTVSNSGANNDVSISSGGSITNLTAPSITADGLTLEAASGIGTAAGPVGGAVNKIEAHAAAGDVYLRADNAVQLGFTGGTKGGVVATAGNVSVTAAGTITVGAANEVVSAGGDVTLQATAGDVVTDNYAGPTGGGQVQAGGRVSVTAANNVTIGATTAGDVHAGNGLTVTATAGTVTIDNGSYAETDAGNVSVTGGTGVTLAQSSADQAHLWNNGAGSISVDAPAFVGHSGGTPASVRAVGGGGVTIRADSVDFADGIDGGATGAVTFVPHTPGTAISLADAVVPGQLTLTGSELGNVSASRIVIGDASSGDLTVAGTVARGGASWDTIELVSGGYVLGTPAGLIQVGKLAMTAGAGIGTSSQSVGTAVANLEANATTGGIYVANTGNLSIGGVSGSLSGVHAAGGPIVLTDAGSVGIEQAGETLSASGNVSVTATGATADIVTGGANSMPTAAVLSTGGSVSLVAGRDVAIGRSDYGDVNAATGLTLQAGRDVTVDNGSFVEANGGNVSVSAGSSVRILQTSADQAHIWDNNGSITISAPNFVSNGGGTPAALATFGTGSISITADTADFPDAIDAGVGSVYFAPFTPGRGITLGGAPVAGTLTLTGAQLGNVSAGQVVIGNINSGTISVAGTVTQGTGWNHLDLFTGGDISDAAGGTLQVDTLGFLALGSVNLGTRAHAVGTVGGIATGSVSFKAGGPLAVAFVDGASGVSSSAGDVTLTADALTLSQHVTATSGAVTLRPLTGGYGIEIGSKPAGVLGLDQADLDNVDSPVLRIGSASAGNVHVGTVTNASATWTTLHLIAGGAVTEDAAGGVTVPSLAVDAGGAVNLAASNNAITTVAGSSAGSTFDVGNPTDLAVGTVDGVNGISAAGRTEISSGGTLTLAGNVSVTGDDLILIAGTGITQTGGAVSATGLYAFAYAGDLTLTAAGNNVLKLAASTPGSVSYTDADGVQVTTVQGNNGIATNGGDVTLTAGGDVVVDQAVTTGGGAFSATVTGGGGFSVVSGTGTIDTRSAVAGSNAGNITVTAAGAVSVATDLTVTGADGNPNGGGNSGAVSLTGSSVSVAGIDTRGGAAFATGTDNGGNAGAVTLTATSGAVTLDGDLNATGGAASSGGTAGSDAAVAVHGPAVLGNNVVITASTVGFDSTLQGSADGGQTLQVTGTGLTTFGGAVGGGGNRLASLTVNGSSSIGDSVTATGDLGFTGPVTVAGDATLTAANVGFGSTVDGGRNLAATVTGAATFGGAVGVTTPLASLTVTGNAHLDSGSVTTAGAQSYGGGRLVLGADTTLTGGAITLGGAVDGSHALTLANTGLATLAGTVGGATPLTTLTVNGTTQITGPQVKTSAGQTYTGAVTVGGDTTLTGTTLTFSATVDDTAAGTHGLTLANSGAATFAGGVGGTAPLGSLSVAGPVAINGGAVKTAGNQTYTGAVTLGADTLVAGSAVHFVSTVDGAHSLTLNNTGLATFGGVVGGTTPLTSLTVGGAAHIDAAQVKTSGAQAYAGPLTLGTSATLTGTTFAFSTIDGAADGAQSLTVTSSNSGTATFGGAVGSTHTLSSLTVSGPAALDTPSVATSGSQSYNGAVTLDRDATLTGSAVSFASTVDANTAGGQGLAIGNSAGTVVFGGNVGSTKKLSHLTVAGATTIGGTSVAVVADQVTFGSTVRATADGGQSLSVAGTSAVTFNGAVGDGGKRLASLTVTGPTVLNGSSVATTGGQTYNSAVTLKKNTTLAGGAVTFASTVNGDAAGAESLAITSSGTATFDAAVGSTSTLASLTVSGPAAISGGSVTTAGAQSYNGATTLGSDTTLTGTTLSFGSTLDAATAGGQGLTLHNSAVATLGGAVGGIHNLKYLTIDGPAALNGPSVATAGSQTYNGPVTLGGNETLTAPTITFATTVDDATSGTHSLTLTNSDLAALNGAVGTAHPLASLSVAGPLALNTGAVNTTGNQAYNSAVTLSKNATLTASSGGVTFARTVDGPVTLHVNTGGTATFAGDVGATTPLKGLSTSGNTRFGTHGVATAVRVSSPDNGTDADVSVGGNLTVAGDVTVRVATGAKNGVRFGGDIDGDQIGQDTLTVLVPWSERSAGSTQLPLITFASANVGTRSQLRALRLNATQAADPANLAAGVDGINGGSTPTVATVYAPSGLNVNVAQDFTMGHNEKLTAGHGDVAITAGATATVGDLNAPGNVTVTAPKIVLQQRPGAPVYAAGGAVTDEGLDFVAGGNVRFNGAFVETSPGGRVTLAYGGDTDPGITKGQLSNVLVRKLANPVTDADMTTTVSGGATVPLDLAGSGTSIVDPAVTIAAATHVTLPAPGNEPGISASQMQMLAEIGINARELTDLEVLDGLDGREMYVQAPGSLDVSVGRLYGKVVTDVLNTYSTFFMQEEKGPDGQTAQVDTRAHMHEVLTKALAAYKTAHSSSPDVDPLDFRSWCETHVEQRGAVDALNKLRSLLVQVEYLGLTPREMAQVKSELFKGIKPDGITMRDFVQAVMGHMATAQ